MKKTSQSQHLSKIAHRIRRGNQQSGSQGPWEFASSSHLFALGETTAQRRAAYRTATGQLRFLPL
jgi:hypothetical protein